MTITAKKSYTYKDYEQLPEGSPYQLIGGELVMTPAPSPYHQIIVGNLFIAMTEFVKMNKLGVVISSPLDVYISDTETYQPDIIFIDAKRRHIIGEKKIEEAPDLVVEILSPSTGYYDLSHKKRMYETSGVREYWIVDPAEKTVEVLVNADGAFKLISSGRGEGKVRSHLLSGFEVTLENIFAK